MPPLTDLDNSFEVKWSLSELENIVYEFINSHDLPKEFFEPVPGNNDSLLNKKPGQAIKKDVSKEDLMKVV